MFPILKCWPNTISNGKWNPEENIPLELKSGDYAGYKLLHHACIHNYPSIVKTLHEHRYLNPTEKADDGVQPIELAAFKENFGMVDKLLEFGCSIDAELSHDQYLKHKKKYHKWSSTFTDKMPLFFYLLFNKCDMKNYFKYNPNLTMLDNKNKTLLMRVIENYDEDLIEFLVKNLEVKELNRQDDNGLAAIHYLFKCQFPPSYSKSLRLKILESLDRRGADLNAMKCNIPEGLPLHMAAFYGYTDMLELLLKKQTYFNFIARPLLYVIKNSDNFNNNLNQPFKNIFNMESLHLILENIYVKRLFGYPVHREEIKLLEQLVEKFDVIKCLVSNYERKYKKIIPTMKSHQVLFGSSNMSIYDVVTASHGMYERVAKNDNFHPVCMIFPASSDMDILYHMISERLQATKRRIVIREQWKKLPISCSFLPYDCLLQIFEHFTNDEWEAFNKKCAINNC